jgi:CRISPR system Cascade subunit CasE
MWVNGGLPEAKLKFKQKNDSMSETQTKTIHMIQMWLDSKRLMQLGRMLHLPLKKVGNNYLVHCALSELFQDQAPKPFSVEDHHRQIADYDGQQIRVLCYSELDWKTLQNLAKGFASPTVYEIVDWERMASKPMPTDFPDGMELGFELRVCPVVRKASDGPKWRKGQELDVFLSKVWEIDDQSVSVDRENTYKEWLIHYFEKQNSADLNSLNIKRFSIERMSRRNHKAKRKVKIIQRPDVTFTGILKIRNGEEFKELLYSGIGRHKSFGFGMLKIRRS